MNKYKEFFKDKKITVMGLGLLGGAVGDAVFLAECGARLTITDLKSNKELKSSLQKLKKFKDIKYTLGEHDFRDFKNKDMILQPGNVPMDSPYLHEARKNKIPIFVSESLFAKYTSDVTIIGVTGTRGKSTTTALIYEILSKNLKGRKVFLGGNVRNVSTLALLNKVKPRGIVVMELDSWALHGMGDIKKSPNISVFTSFMPDHMNYYKGSMKDYFADKANIFKYQGKDDVLIIRPDMKKLIPLGHSRKGEAKSIKSKLIVVSAKDADKYTSDLPGKFQKENLACAIAVAKQLKISDIGIKKTIKNFKGLEGRLQYVKTIKGVKIYNDNNATTPEATMAGIEALSLNLKDKKIVLICGGNDKGLDLKKFTKVIDKYCKLVVTIPGIGTDRLFDIKFKSHIMGTKNLKEAVKVAFGEAKSGDTLLFSPAFSSFSQYSNEYERGDEFIEIIKTWK